MSGFIVQGGILDFLTSSGGKLDLFLKITLTPGTTAFYRPSPPNRTNLNARLEEDKRAPHARLASRTPSRILVASEKGDPN